MAFARRDTGDMRYGESPVRFGAIPKKVMRDTIPGTNWSRRS